MGKVKIYPIYITMNFYFHKTVHVKKRAICVFAKNNFLFRKISGLISRVHHPTLQMEEHFAFILNQIFDHSEQLLYIII